MERIAKALAKTNPQAARDYAEGIPKRAEINREAAMILGHPR